MSAIAKIQSEMDANKANGYVQVVGAFLLHHLESNPNDAGMIMADGKTILKSLDEMKKVAEKKKVGNCGVIDPQEGFAIVLKYFGIDSAPAPFGCQPRETIAVKSSVAPPPKSNFDIKLEDLL